MAGAKVEKEKELLTLESPIEALLISELACNCLRNNDIKTIADLMQKSEAEIRRIPNFGKLSLEEVVAALSQHGFHLQAPTR